MSGTWTMGLVRMGESRELTTLLRLNVLEVSPRSPFRSSSLAIACNAAFLLDIHRYMQFRQPTALGPIAVRSVLAWLPLVTFGKMGFIQEHEAL